MIDLFFFNSVPENNNEKLLKCSHKIKKLMINLFIQAIQVKIIIIRTKDLKVIYVQNSIPITLCAIKN
jgi:hypothetical protein